MKNKKLKLVIASGKGGVGKSMISSALTMLFAKEKKVVAVDCDVDAPNLHLWLGEDEKWDKVEKISTNEIPVIDRKKCTLCGKCVDICAFGALSIKNQRVEVNKFLCEGCGAGEAVCPVNAIVMKRVKNAEVRIKKIRFHQDFTKQFVLDFPLVSAQLYPGQTGSGKVVEEIRQKAEKYDYELMILDSPAGAGCPVIAALQGSDFALLVTEPTPSGQSDLNKVLQVVNHFDLPYAVVVNKWDINEGLSLKIEKEFRDRLIGKISYNKRIFNAIANLTPILETNLPVKLEIENIFNNIKKQFLKEGSL